MTTYPLREISKMKFMIVHIEQILIIVQLALELALEIVKSMG
jgi:hypothetical protein